VGFRERFANALGQMFGDARAEAEIVAGTFDRQELQMRHVAHFGDGRAELSNQIDSEQVAA
jgi:hypothetical protein